MTYILIAEDDRDISLLVQRKLEISGYPDVWSTRNGEEALQKALQDPPRLMILDIMLPDLDGLHICEQVKEALGASAPPVIIMSARGQKNHLEEGRIAGADAYIIKPFSPRDLIQTVDDLLA